MTTPSQPQQAQPQGDAAQDTALALAVAQALATAATVDIAVQMIQAQVRLQIVMQSARGMALHAALGIVMGHPPGQEGFYGAAGQATARLNLMRRAQFVITSTKRLAADVITARSQDQPLPLALASGISRERRYYAQHMLAIWQRQKAGAQADSAAMSFGRLLGWHTVRDARTSAECLAAGGKNFYADHMPLIGYPGAVHPHCRCMPGVPFPGAAVLPSHGIGQVITIPVRPRAHRRAA